MPPLPTRPERRAHPGHAARRARAVVVRLAAALLAAAAGSACAGRGAGFPIGFPAPGREGAPGRRAPAPRAPVPRAPAPAAGVGARALAAADAYVGVPYRWGGTSPRTGFDCSGLVQYVYGREGVELPRTSRQQAAAGVRRATRWDAAGAGDLVLFAEEGEAVSHVAFYVGGGRILHASASGGGVRYDDLATRRGRWYRERLVAVRRVSGRGPAVARGLLRRLGLAEPAPDPPDRAPPP